MVVSEARLASCVSEADIDLGIRYGEVEYNAESAVNILLDVVRDKSKKANMDDVQVRFPTHVEDVGRVLRQIAGESRASRRASNDQSGIMLIHIMCRSYNN